MPERRALLVTTRSASLAWSSGATLRADEVEQLLVESGHAVERRDARSVDAAGPTYDMLVGVSYACAGAVRRLHGRARRTWLDAVDSWLLVNGSAVRSGHPSYGVRAVRDAARLAALPRVDLVTYISAADLAQDRGTVRGRRRLVLPCSVPGHGLSAEEASPRIVLAGDWEYAPNRDGLAWFLREVLPHLRRLRPEQDVVVYGRGAERLPAMLGVRVLGYAEDARELHRAGDVHAAPVRFGGGVKRKVVQPLLLGLPVVTTRAGAHGLRPHPSLRVHEDAKAFAGALATQLERTPSVQPVAAADVVDRDDRLSVLAWATEQLP